MFPSNALLEKLSSKFESAPPHHTLACTRILYDLSSVEKKNQNLEQIHSGSINTPKECENNNTTCQFPDGQTCNEKKISKIREVRETREQIEVVGGVINNFNVFLHNQPKATINTDERINKANGIPTVFSSFPGPFNTSADMYGLHNKLSVAHNAHATITEKNDFSHQPVMFPFDFKTNYEEAKLINPYIFLKKETDKNIQLSHPLINTNLSTSDSNSITAPSVPVFEPGPPAPIFAPALVPSSASVITPDPKKSYLFFTCDLSSDSDSNMSESDLDSEIGYNYAYRKSMTNQVQLQTRHPERFPHFPEESGEFDRATTESVFLDSISKQQSDKHFGAGFIKKLKNNAKVEAQVVLEPRLGEIATAETETVTSAGTRSGIGIRAEAVIGPRAGVGPGSKAGIGPGSKTGIDAVFTVSMGNEIGSAMDVRPNFKKTQTYSFKNKNANNTNERFTPFYTLARIAARHKDHSSKSFTYTANVQQKQTKSEEEEEEGLGTETGAKTEAGVGIWNNNMQFSTTTTKTQHHDARMAATSRLMSKKYHCELCNNKFTRRSNLKRHYRIHTGEKKYNCAQCTKRFTEKHHLDSHLKVHENLRSFVCNTCNSATNDYANMCRHVFKKHGEEASLRFKAQVAEQKSRKVKYNTLDKHLSFPNPFKNPFQNSSLYSSLDSIEPPVSIRPPVPVGVSIPASVSVPVFAPVSTSGPFRHPHTWLVDNLHHCSSKATGENVFSLISSTNTTSTNNHLNNSADFEEYKEYKAKMEKNSMSLYHKADFPSANSTLAGLTSANFTSTNIPSSNYFASVNLPSFGESLSSLGSSDLLGSIGTNVSNSIDSFGADCGISYACNA